MGEVKATVLDVAKFPEFSEGELNRLFNLFVKFAEPPSKKGGIRLEGLKRLLQALELTQTHLQAKETHEKYATDEGHLDLNHFIRLVKDLTAKNGTISLECVMKVAAQEEVSVDEVGVGGAKMFFEAKAKVLEVGDAAFRAFEDKKKEEEDKRIKKEEFRRKRDQFQETDVPAE